MKKNKKISKKGLTNRELFVIIVSVAEMYPSEKDGSIAQLGEHLPYKQRVIGSSPVVPTSTQVHSL